jgi:hypothetical protein
MSLHKKVKEKKDMKAFFHTIKRWDVIIIFALILLSFLPFAIFSYQFAGESDDHSQYVAVISVDNETVKEITLTDNKGIETFDITQPNGDSNTIEVRDNRIRIKGATCPDQVCVRTGFISKPGKTIVCLPHKVVIEIHSIDGHTNDEIISS